MNRLAVYALLAALAAGLLASMYAKGRLDGKALATAKLNAQTEQAIGEISNAADRAKFNRRLCVDAGGVYDFATSKCKKA